MRNTVAETAGRSVFPKSRLIPKRETTSLRTALLQRYQSVRQFSEKICETLVAEDMVVQTMPEASPTKWHLAHTSWFFETFVLRAEPRYRPLDERYAQLFNSYYNAVGEQHPRAGRGALSRPTVAEVRAYRRHVDGAMA